MTEIIKYLKNEHIVMLTLLKRCKSNKLTLDQRSAYLTTVKLLLADHLVYEDLNLYPKLKELSTANNNALDTVKEFTAGLETIGNIISNFFKKSEEDEYNIHNSSDYTKIIKLLEVRIHKEESDLYPLYDKLVKEKK
ncbi:MAG: hemerythrin domain-containing protein [Spirochaetaceae bacterium]